MPSVDVQKMRYSTYLLSASVYVGRLRDLATVPATDTSMYRLLCDKLDHATVTESLKYSLSGTNQQCPLLVLTSSARARDCGSNERILANPCMRALSAKNPLNAKTLSTDVA